MRDCATLEVASEVTSETEGWLSVNGCATLMGASEVTFETKELGG